MSPKAPGEPAARSPRGGEDPAVLVAIRALQAGAEPEAFEPIDRFFRPALIRHFLRRYLTTEDAEDLTQEALLRAQQKIDQFRFESSFSTWLLKIAENLRLNRRRADAAKKRRATLVPIDDGAVAADHNPKMAEERPGPERVLRSKESLQRIEVGLETLPPGMRRCLLWWSQGLSYREIAQLEGVSEGTVRSQIHRARQKLQRLLDGEDDNGGPE